MLDWTLGAADVARERQRTLEPVSGTVLEIGFGTGLNLPHYTDRVNKLTAIDSERMLPKRVEKRIRESALQVEPLQLDASETLPFADDTFDCVVTTFTLCSISALQSTLAEIRRVLKAGGRYVFLEHGRSDDLRVARRQDLLNPIQRFIGRGCNINRPIGRIIEQAGFEIVVLDRFLMPSAPRVLGEMYRGAAKPEKA